MMDITDLGEFYSSRLGQVARRLIAHRVRSRWKSLKGANVLGLGYAQPYLGVWQNEAQSIYNFMPRRLGATHWPADKPGLTALVDEKELPLDDSSIDFALLVHSIELSHHLPHMLAEIWRVMSAQGKIVVIAPNRRGMWARFDTTPFGYGRPFSRRQITQNLREARFAPSGWSNAVFMPPFSHRFLLRSAPAFERAGMWISPGFSGVLIVEASKQVYSVSKPAVQKSRLQQLSPQGVTAPALTPHSKL
jgi:SAM-dependent methyltransferase